MAVLRNHLFFHAKTRVVQGVGCLDGYSAGMLQFLLQPNDRQLCVSQTCLLHLHGGDAVDAVDGLVVAKALDGPQELAVCGGDGWWEAVQLCDHAICPFLSWRMCCVTPKLRTDI